MLQGFYLFKRLSVQEIIPELLPFLVHLFIYAAIKKTWKE